MFCQPFFLLLEKILYILYNKGMIKLYILKGESDAYALVRKIAAEKFNNAEILKTDMGKPYLKDVSGFCFNISHTDGMTVLALSDSEVGVDAEKVKKADLRIAKRRFLKNECDYVLKADSDKRFFEIWTKKEAFLKCKGVGLSGGLKSVNVFDCNPKIKTFFIDGFAVSVCGNGEIEIIKK